MLIAFILAYFAIILVLAKVFTRKINDVKDFFLAGRSLGALPVAIAFTAGWFGAASTIGSVNLFYKDGVSGLWQLVLPSIVSCLIITFFIAKRVAAQNSLSQPEAVEKHYGREGRFLLSLIILAATTSFVGSQLVAAGKLFEATLGLGRLESTLLLLSVVLTYSCLGGFIAVVITDFAQFVFFTLSFLILVGFSIHHGIANPDFLAEIARNRPDSFWRLDTNLTENLFLLMTFVPAWVIAPEMWQRMSATKNPQTAFKAAGLATLFLFILFCLVFTVGLTSANLVSPSDRVLVDLALSLPQPWLGSLVLVGVVAAIASTMDSSMNVGSLTLTNDLYHRYFRPNASEQELVWVGRVATVLVTIPAVIIALSFENIIQVLWISADIYASTMFFPIIGLLYLKKPGRWSGVLAMLLGGITVLISALNQYGAITMDFWPTWPYSTLLGITVSGIGFGLGYWLSRREKVVLPENGSEALNGLNA